MSLDSLTKFRNKFQSGDRLPQLKIGKDESVVTRILPGNFGPKKDLFFVGLAQHWLPSKQGAILCRNYHLGDEEVKGECPICEFRTELYAMEDEISALEKSGKNMDEQRKLVELMINDTRKTFRFAMNVVDRRDKQGKLYYSPKTVFDGICNSVLENGEEILDPEAGHDFKITRKDEKKRTSYDVQPVIAKNALAESAAAIEELLTGRKDLDTLVKVPERDEVDKELARFRAMREGGEGGYESEVSGDSAGVAEVFEPAKASEPAPASTTAHEKDVTTDAPTSATKSIADAATQFADAADDDEIDMSPPESMEEPPGLGEPEPAPASATPEGKSLLSSLGNLSQD